jgi:hypothetical protein
LGIVDQGDLRDAGRNLLEQLQPLRRDRCRIVRESCHIAAGLRHACYKAFGDRIGAACEHDRYGVGRRMGAAAASDVGAKMTSGCRATNFLGVSVRTGCLVRLSKRRLGVRLGDHRKWVANRRDNRIFPLSSQPRFAGKIAAWNVV